MQVVNLGGPQGNALVIDGMALDVAKRLGRSEAQIRELIVRFRSGTYNDLLNAIDLEFPYLFQFVNDPRTTAERNAIEAEQDRRFPAFLPEVGAAERRQKLGHR
jgi:hypothetical protein